MSGGAMSGGPLVILDIGNTLVRGPDRGPARRLAAALGLGRDGRRALRTALMTRPFESPGELAAFVRAELGAADPGPAVAELWSAQEHEAEPVEGALDALTALRASGLRLALVSNIWRPYLTSVRRHLGAFIDEHVPVPLQVFSFQAGVAKPDPAIFRLALERAGVAARDAVMVGDTPEEDIAPAAALGMRTIQVGPGAPVRSIADVDAGLVTGGSLARSRG